MPIGLREAGHVRDRGDVPGIDQRLHLRGQRPCVVDRVVRAELDHPVARGRPRRGRHHGQARELASELYHDRSHAARGAHDEQRAGGLGREAESIEQQLPRGDGCQRQCRGLGIRQRGRRIADDALVDALKFGVAPGWGDVSGVPDALAGLE